jgi:Gpi18-like mannosyltransferase
MEKAAVLAFFIALALLLRLLLSPFMSHDMSSLLTWLLHVKKHGILAYGTTFTTYPPLYSYLLGLVSLITPPISSVLAIKLISIAFDFVCSFFVYRVVSLRFRDGYAPILALIAFLFAPTVILNSSVWGQNDMVYTVWLVACVYFLATEHHWAATLCFGLALAVKLQAIFLAPLLIVLCLRRALPWKTLLLIPVPYLVSIVPAWALGSPLHDLLTVYFGQTAAFPLLSDNAASLYAWIPNRFFAELLPASLVFAFAMVCLYILVASRRRTPLTTPVVVQLATFSVLLMPFVLPEMHERFFFAADVLSILFAFYFPSYFFVPILVGGVSLFSYLPYLFAVTPVSYSVLAFVQLGTIVILARHLMTTLFPHGPNPLVG